jgi:hypothetical protein
VSGEARKCGKTQLALALLRGISIAEWASAAGVPAPTAYRWARDPDVRKTVESCRRRSIDQAVGQMTRNSKRSVGTIVKIAKRGDSHAIRLRAARAILSEMMPAFRYAGLEERMSELERQFEQSQAGVAGSDDWSPAQANYGLGTTPPAVRGVSAIDKGAD